MERAATSPVSRWRSRALLVMVAFVLVVTSCSKEDQPGQGAAPAPATKPDAALTAMDPVNASMAFESTGESRDGWWWVGEGQKARWSYRQFPAELTDLQLDVAMMVDAKTAEPTKGAVFELTYGQADAKLGSQSVSVPLTPNPKDPNVLVASGAVTLPKATLPDGLASLWVEATTPAGSPVAMRGDSLHFSPLALPGQTAAAAVNRTTRAPGAPAPSNKPSGVLTGDFTSDGDPISGWYWLRDAAGARSGTWTFTGVPSGKQDLRLEFEVLATDTVNGGPGVDATFYVDYAAGGAGSGGTTDGSAKPKPSSTPKPRPSSSTSSTLPAGTGANSQLVTLTNTSPANDPVGYTNTGTITIPRAKIPAGTQTLVVTITRADADGANVVSDHVAVRQEAVKLAWGTTTGGSTTTTTDSTTTTTTTTTTDDGTGGGTEGTGGGDTTGPGSDTDLTDDANSMDDATARGDLANGEYDGSLQDEDDDWFAFQMAGTQLVDIAVTPDGGASIETELWNPSRMRRVPDGGDANRMAFTHAAARSDGGQWYLHLRRMNGVNTTYTFTINVRDANDGARGIDAGEDAAGSMAVTFQTFTGELQRDDGADNYTVQLAAGLRVSATLTPLGDADFAVELRPPTGSSYDDGTTGGEALTLTADSGSTTTPVRIVITRVGDAGGRYKLQLTTSTSSDCVVDPVPAASFATSGANSSRVVHRDEYGNPTDLLLSGEPPVNDPGNWRWLQANADLPASQTAQWVFDQRPNGDDDYRFVLDVPLAAAHDYTAPDGAVYVAYGAVPGSGVDAVQGGELVGLTTSETGSVTGFSGHAEIVVPHAAMADATQAVWVRIGLVDPTGTRPTAKDAGVGVAPASLRLCVGVRGTTDLAGTSGTQPAAPTVSYHGDTKQIVASSSIFTDPATDLDHDGINQGFENAAEDLVDPILVLDEEEMWLHNRASERTNNFVTVSPYPSSLHPTYVIFSYLSTWSYDAGGGLQQTAYPATKTLENHRGDSERVFTAWKVLDDRTLALEWVNTSAHKSINSHDGVWHVTDRTCNTANWALVTLHGDSLPTFGVGGSEPMCANLTFDDQGRLMMFTAENKHAMYPTEALCEAISLGKLAGSRVYGEDCGWQPGTYSWSWTESDFNDDPRYLGNGKWRFAVYNVGEPGYPLIDDFEQENSWQGVTSDQRARLMNSYNTDAVWRGNLENSSQFCGGKAAGGPRQYPPGTTYPAGDCSTRLGSKYEGVPAALDAALRSRYRIEIKTGNVDGAGTDEYIWWQVLDSSNTVLAGRGNYLGDLERNATDIVWLAPQHTGGAPAKVLVGRSSNEGNRPDWYLESITVEDKVGGTIHTYPANRWIEQFQTYTLNG